MNEPMKRNTNGWITAFYIFILLVFVAAIAGGIIYTCAICNSDLPLWLKCYLLRG